MSLASSPVRPQVSGGPVVARQSEEKVASSANSFSSSPSIMDKDDGPPLLLLHRVHLSPSYPIPLEIYLDSTHKRMFSVGRQKDKVDFVLDSTNVPNMISRTHCFLEFIDPNSSQGSNSGGSGAGASGRWRIRDNNSVNGLFVNNVKVSEALLSDGDVITLGGGGNTLLGTQRTQPGSEFTYTVELVPRSAAANKRRRSDLGFGSQESSSQQSEKRLKMSTSDAAETARLAQLQAELEAMKRKFQEEEEQRRRVWEEEQARLREEAAKKEAEAEAGRLREMERLRQEFANERESLQRQAEDERRRLEVEQAKVRELESSVEEVERARQAEEERVKVLKALEERSRELEEKHRKEVELMTAQSKQLMEEKTKAERALQEEAQRMELERQTVQKELEKSREMQSGLVNAKKLLQKYSTTGLPMLRQFGEMIEQLECRICDDLPFQTVTLECTHSFCSTCIYDWLMKSEAGCPQCRQMPLREPLPNRSINEHVLKLLDTMKTVTADYEEACKDAADMSDDSDLAEKKELCARLKQTVERYKLRLKEKSEQQRIEDEKANLLQASIEAARKRNATFLDITTAWIQADRDTFRQGISAYTRRSRKVYASTVGLTVEFVNSAPASALSTAIANLQLKAPPPVAGSTSALLEAYRKRIILYFLYGNPLFSLPPSGARPPA